MITRLLTESEKLDCEKVIADYSIKIDKLSQEIIYLRYALNRKYFDDDKEAFKKELDLKIEEREQLRKRRLSLRRYRDTTKRQNAIKSGTMKISRAEAMFGKKYKDLNKEEMKIFNAEIRKNKDTLRGLRKWN